MTQEIKNGYVKWQVFAWIVAIATLLIGATFANANMANVKAENNRVDIREIQTELRTTVKNIDDNVKDIKSDIKAGLLDHIKDTK